MELHNGRLHFIPHRVPRVRDPCIYALRVGQDLIKSAQNTIATIHAEEGLIEHIDLAALAPQVPTHGNNGGGIDNCPLNGDHPTRWDSTGDYATLAECPLWKLRGPAGILTGKLLAGAIREII